MCAASVKNLLWFSKNFASSAAASWCPAGLKCKSSNYAQVEIGRPLERGKRRQQVETGDLAGGAELADQFIGIGQLQRPQIVLGHPQLGKTPLPLCRVDLVLRRQDCHQQLGAVDLYLPTQLFDASQGQVLGALQQGMVAPLVEAELVEVVAVFQVQ